MSFKAERGTELWDYIVGDPVNNLSIMTDRWNYLRPLLYQYGNSFKVSFRDINTNAWTKWITFPGAPGNLLTCKKLGKWDKPASTLEPAIDVHRSILENEIIVESDYPTYEENYEAAKIVGAIIEQKGFIPHYYYSGNKSIHCLPTKTAVFIKTRLGIRKSHLEEVERLINRNQSVEIMAPNGFIKVIKATRRKQKENEKLVRIYTRNGKRLDMSQDHLQLINRKHKIIVVQAKCITTSDRIIYSLQDFEGYGGNFKLGKFLGWFLAEGSVNKGMFQFTLHKNETHISNFIKQLAEEYGSRVRIINEDECIRIQFVCHTLESFVNDYSIGKIAKTKGLKAVTYGMSKQFRKGIIDGWFEGDGDHKLKNFGVTVSSGLAKSIVALCTSLGIRTSKHSYITKTGYLPGSRFYKITKIKCQGNSTISTLPNYLCGFDTIKYINKSFIKKTDLIDIEVDSKNHLFCLDNGIITHNCHVFIDWEHFLNLDNVLTDQLRIMFKGSMARFKNSFITWLRKKMISAWDTNVKEFDKDLEKPKHLIRAELSKNKRGFKTFLGYSFKDMSMIPYICNESNRIYPEIGKIRLSNPPKINELIEEFLKDSVKSTTKQRAIKKNSSLTAWSRTQTESLRDCIKAILSDEFKELGDGTSRAMFILVNELRKVYGDTIARTMIYDWNSRMGNPIKRDYDIEYRFKSKTYSLSCDYIHKFLNGLGFDVSAKCRGKL